ncbi:MAG: hypothetical protein JXA99_15375 [Candidatus Lokiarchaeota archaeon]|nr:hypothetical protein [Candidatus Lokiarchaeota archaeon]
MSLITYILLNGFLFTIILTSYLLFIMIEFSPRIWGFSDYTKKITADVPVQTREEKKKAMIIYVFFLLIGIGFPIISTLILKYIYYGGKIDFLTVFFNIFIMIMFANIADYVLLDWLIVATITPKFVIIPGTEHMKNKEYKEFRIYHAIAHLKGTIFLIILSIILALIFWLI